MRRYVVYVVEDCSVITSAENLETDKIECYRNYKCNLANALRLLLQTPQVREIVQ